VKEGWEKTGADFRDYPENDDSGVLKDAAKERGLRREEGGRGGER